MVVRSNVEGCQLLGKILVLKVPRKLTKISTDKCHALSIQILKQGHCAGWISLPINVVSPSNFAINANE